MEQIIPNVHNETGKLQVVILGLPDSMGAVPQLHETFDPRSYETISLGIYPTQADVTKEMQGVLHTLESQGVKVLRPKLVENYNQVFARDVCFVIDETLFVSNLIPDRGEETAAFDPILDLIPSGHIEFLPEEAHTEGGDIILYNDYLFVGCYFGKDYPNYKMARTNHYAVEYLKERFPHKQIIPLELRKHDQDPRQGVLHLDCAFQPVGDGKAIFYPEGLLNAKDRGLVEEIFGKENIFYLQAEEAYNLTSNIVSLSPKKVISDSTFSRLNTHLTEAWGIEVLPVAYREVCKMGGLLRCSTMPLVRQ